MPEKGLKKDGNRRWPVVETLVRDVIRKERFGRDNPQFHRDRLQERRRRDCRRSLNGILAQVLPLRLDRPSFDGLGDVSGRCQRSAKPCGQTQCQAADHHRHEYTNPAVFHSADVWFH